MVSYYQHCVICILIVAKKGLLQDKKDFWRVLERVEKYTHEAADITTSVREMPKIKSVTV